MQGLKPAEPTIDPAQEFQRVLDHHGIYRKMINLWAEAGLPFKDVIQHVARDYVAAAVAIEGGNKSKAAERLGMHRNSVTRREGKVGGV